MGEVVLGRLAPGHRRAVTSPCMGMAKLQVIGGGKMGEALLAGLRRGGGATAGELRAVEKLPDRAAQLRAAFPGMTVAGDPDVAHGHVLAVKPGGVETAGGAPGGD